VGLKLDIRGDVNLPRDVKIVVDQSGLLGDCFIDILPPEHIDPNNLIKPGETVIGSTKPGLDVLQQKGTIVLSKLADEIDEVKKLTVSMNDELLGKQNLENLRQTFEHLRVTSENLSTSSKKLDAILAKGDTALDTVNKAAADLRTSMEDFKKLSENANRTLDSAKAMVETGNRVLKKADEGQGALGVLLSDRETAANLKAFVANLKRSGPVFYKDRPVEQAATPVPKKR
jgi:ABC-type transporter Mla subunit MlaD